jgi:MraZ protein
MDQEPISSAGIAAQGVFVSRFTHALDPKKRITIPSEWREQIGKPESVYVIPNMDSKCLNVFPAKEMARRIEKFRLHSISDSRARQFARNLASQSDLVQWDVQGRIRIKDGLLEFAGLVGEVVLVGAFDSFEIWNPEQLGKSGGLDQGTLLDAARYVGF